jgi:glycosyltransferase involved in cell wall biosynthesis
VRVGLYDPHLSTLGGGERYFLTVLEEAARMPDARVTLLSPTRPDPAEWRRRLGVVVEPGSFDWVEGLDAEVTAASADLDLLFAMCNEVPPLSRARRSVAMVQFPHRTHRDARARALAALGLSRAPAALASYELFVCNSEFTREHVARRLGVDALVIAPPVELPAGEPLEKEPLILSVGRFFRRHHSKNQHLLVDALARLDAPGWRLVLAGGGDDPGYVDEVRRRAEGLPAEVRVDVPRDELRSLYGRASLFWHAAGHGQDARRRPERLEHFGIATVEAMGHGAVPLVFPAGGQLELVDDGRNGRHWTSVDELAALTRALVADGEERARLASTALEDARRFATPRFRAAIRELVLHA